MLNVDFGFDIADPGTYLPTAKNLVSTAIGTGTPSEQIVANILITTGLILSSSIGFLVGIPLAMASLFLLSLGVLRLWSPVGSRWPL